MEIGRRVVEKMEKSGRPEIATVFGSAASPHKPILEYLFPRFVDGVAGGGNRLSRRRNLVRMLYLGNPPGVISRREIEAIWQLWAADMIERLLETTTDGALPEFLDRLDDLLPELPETGDNEFWTSLAKVFVRDRDWLDGPDSTQALSRDAAKSLARLGFRDPNQVLRVRRAVDALIADGDLVIAPWILRNEMREYGLVGRPAENSGNSLYEKSEILELMDRELTRYREAIASGYALKRLPSMEIFFAITNASKWDEELRASLTGQLESDEAVGTFAALLVPPGYVAERKTIDQLCDAESLNRRVTEQLAREDAFPDPWIRESVKRLHRILNGREPHFDD